MNGMNNQTGTSLTGIAHLQQSIRDILTTPIGSRVMHRDYGSRLFQKIDAPITGELIAEIYADVVDALFNFEPRLKISSVSIVKIESGTIDLELKGIYVPSNESITIKNISIS